MGTTRHDVMDEVLRRTDTLGFETGPGFSAHATMAAEALFTLGFPDEAAPWCERYVASVQYHPRPATTARIDPEVEADWGNARGDRRRVGDWMALFDQELEEGPWRDVLGRWWPRLIPGALGGLTHGLIRTAHAVRTLDAVAQPTPPMRRELAAGLAYWAAVYSPPAAPPTPQGARTPAEAIAGLPALDRRAILGLGNRSLKEEGEPIPDRSEFDDALDELAAPPADLDRALLGLTSAFAGALRARAATNAAAPVHTVTAPAAARLLLPYLPPEAQQQTYASVWRSAASVCAAFTKGSGDGSAPGDREPLSIEELGARAASNGTAHAIKLTEACLREYRDNPDPVYLLAVEDVLPRLGRDSQE